VTWASTALGNAASFDGVDDEFTITHNSNYNAGTTGALSVSAWVYVNTATDYRVVVCKDDSNTTREWLITYDYLTSKFRFHIWNSSGGLTNVQSATTYPLSTWFHVVQTWDGTNLKGYVNGAEVATVAASITPRTTSLDVKIGDNTNNQMDGYIQNVRIYNRALSATEVATLFNRPWEGTNSGTLWPYSPPAPADATLSTDTAATSLNVDLEGWWLTTDNTGTTLVDISGNGRDATLNGTNSWVADSVGAVNRFDNSSSNGNNARTANTQPDLTSGYTATFWVKHEEAAATGNKYGAGLALTDGSGTGSWWNTISSDLELYFNTSSSTSSQWPQIVQNRNNGGTISAYAFNDSTRASQNDVWKFWAITFDGTNARIYRDASLIGTSGTLAAPLSTTGKHIVINGVADTATGLTCSMQNIRLYSRALSADEVTLLYERPFEGLTYGDAFHYDPPTPANLTPLTSDSINNSQIGWWALTETDDYASGAADISGNANNGTQSGGVLSEVSPLGGVASFDGVNDIIDASAYTIASTSSMTMAGWIRYTSTVGSVSVLNICNAGGGTTAQYTRNIGVSSSGTAACTVQSGTAIAQAVGSTVFDIGEWYFVVGTFDKVGSSYDVEIFVNGVSEATASGTGSELIPYTNTCIGGARRYNNAITAVEPCEIHNVRLWDRILTSDEIWSIYKNPWLGSAYQASAAAVYYNYIFRSKRFRRLS
jgi:hypothetical protein